MNDRNKNPDGVELPVSSSGIQCCGCSEYFKGSPAFKKHRTGSVELKYENGPYTQTMRRCMSRSEMLEAGMSQVDGGYWVTSISLDWR